MKAFRKRTILEALTLNDLYIIYTPVYICLSVSAGVALSCKNIRNLSKLKMGLWVNEAKRGMEMFFFLDAIPENPAVFYPGMC